MKNRTFDIGIITDEVIRDISQAFAICADWDIFHFELREGEKARFPGFTAAEIARVDEAVQSGAIITAVSPGIFKGNIEDEHRWQKEAEQIVPRAIELARRFDCNVMIAFGFEDCDNSASNRVKVLRALETIGELAAGASMQVAIENEPGYWIDRPDETVALLRELGHPAVKLNWDPANLHWGGQEPTRAALETLLPHIINLHIKDYTPEDEDVPWQPLGKGIVPWEKLLPSILELTTLAHGTVETHCEPLIENSDYSVQTLRTLLLQSAAEQE